MNRVFLIILLGLCLGLIATSFYFDRPVREAIVESQGSDWNRSEAGEFWGAVSKWGDWPQLMVFGAVLLGIAIKTKRRDWIQVIAAAMIASTVAGIFANMSRLTTGRTRPRDEVRIGVGFHGPWHDGRITIGMSSYNAFPSGHTATAVGFAAPLLFGKPMVGILAMAAAFAIAWSRMQLGAHHLSDVVASILLATFVGWAVLRLIRIHGASWWERGKQLANAGYRKFSNRRRA